MFSFSDTTTTEFYTLSLHELFRSSPAPACRVNPVGPTWPHPTRRRRPGPCKSRGRARRSEEHTSELQSQSKLVCRLLPEKKNSCRKPHFSARRMEAKFSG